MTQRYTVQVTTTDPQSAKPLPVPSVTVMCGRVKMAKMLGSDLDGMKERATFVARALEAYDAEAER